MARTTSRRTDSDIRADGRISEELVAAYRVNGFVRVRGVLAPGQVERFRAGAEAFLAAHRTESLEKQGVFRQLVNVWQRDEVLRELTFDARLGRIAEQLAGFPLRLWHDQMLVKEPHNNAATEFHQDRPYWPHEGDRLALSVWTALVDVPPERGCMTFLPGTQNRAGLRAQDLHREEDLFELDPSLRWLPRVTVPLQAGDCTFHSGRTAHMALPNRTDRARLAHVTIYMDEATRFNGGHHVVTDPLGLAPGDRLDGATFPRPWARTSSHPDGDTPSDTEPTAHTRPTPAMPPPDSTSNTTKDIA
ncbi:phytanoyl-CoA dioxygenase family protein [Streptodolium elevatio]